jgi:hypothetical protein
MQNDGDFLDVILPKVKSYSGIEQFPKTVSRPTSSCSSFGGVSENEAQLTHYPV